MSITSSELAALASEIYRTMSGRRVVKIYEVEKDIIFTFREDKSLKLLINTAPPLARIHLTRKAANAPASPSAFALLLRKHLSGQKISAIEKDEGDRLVKIVFSPSEDILHCRFFGSGGFLLTDSNGAPMGSSGWGAKTPSLTPFPRKEGTSEPPATFIKSPSEEVEERYGAMARESQLEESRKRMLAKARQELKRLEKLMKGLKEDSERLKRYAPFKAWGDICKTWFDRIPAGRESVSLPDPSTGEDVEIPLDPSLPPADNLNRLYRLHKKYRTGMEKIGSATAGAAVRKERLEEKIERISLARTMEELPQEEGGQKKPPAAKTRKEKKEKSGPFRKIISEDGFEIRIGRNDRQNDELVRKSNGNDIWFHVRDFPGSHVVIRSGKGGQVPYSTIIEAAKLALKHSSRAKDGKGTVVYTHVKYLKKPKHAPPGKVLVTKEKTVNVRLS